MEVKIVEFSGISRGRGERILTQLVNQGWRIVAAGGGGFFTFPFVVLQRGDKEHQGKQTPAAGSATRFRPRNGLKGL